MFVKLTAKQTCDTVLLQHETTFTVSGIDACLKEMSPGDTVLVTHGRDALEVWCAPCAWNRFDRTQ